MGARTLVLFDLDETLFDHKHAIRLALADLQSRHAPLRTVSLDTLIERARSIVDTVHLALLEGRIDPAAARIERMRQLFLACGDSPDAAFLDRTAALYGGVYRSLRRAVPGSADVLARFRDQRSVWAIGILTNHFTEA